jgi:phage-related protein (TIGR01555 family)
MGETPPPDPDERTDASIASVWQNQQTGMGTVAKDKITGHVPVSLTILLPQTMATLFYGDAIARRIVEKKPEEAFKRGFDIVYRGENERSTNMVPDLETMKTSLGLVERSKRAAIMGRLFGGSGIILGTNGGNDESAIPLDPKSVRSLDYLHQVDRRELLINSFKPPRGSDHFPEHESYRLVVDSQKGTPGIVGVDASRVVMWGANLTALRDRSLYFQGWDCPVLQTVWEKLRGFNSDHESASNMLVDGSQAVLSIPDLWKVVSQQGLTMLESKLSTIQSLNWIGRIMPISADEDYQFISRTFAGIPDLLEGKQALVAAAADMPIALLFGRSAAGMSATGEYDIESWLAGVESWRKTECEPQITEIVQLMAQANGAQDPEKFGISWPDLAPLSIQDQADLEKTHAETDEKRIAQGFPADSMIEQRYGGEEYQVRTPTLTEDDKAALEAKPDLPTAPDPEVDLPDLEELEPLENEELVEVITGEPSEAVDPGTALNGAQVKSLTDIVLLVSTRQIPRESGVNMIVAAFPVDEMTADEIMGEVGITFFAPDELEEGTSTEVADQITRAIRVASNRIGAAMRSGK